MLLFRLLPKTALPLKLLLVCTAAFLFAGSQGAQGQSLSLFSRNHPEIDWRVATTEHFKIIHPARLDAVASQAAPIAETTYDSLATALDTTFSERIRIYLTDQDGIANGFAAPFGGGYTDIWVHPNDWARRFSAPFSWLRTVLPHEITHIFHYQTGRGPLGTWDNLFWQHSVQV